MKLSDKERRILRAIELDADRSLSQIRRETRLRDHSIRYSIDRLRERGVVTRRPFINIYPLGYVDYAIYFSLAAEQESLKERFLEYLTNSERISWLAVLGGDFQYGMAICATHQSEVVAFLNSLSSSFPSIFFHKALSVRVALTLFARKYLYPSDRKVNSLDFGGAATGVSLDQKDHRILQALEKAGEKSLRQLSSELEIPIASLQYRLEQLKQKQILRGFMYQINAEAFGMQAYRLLIQLKGISASIGAQLYRFAAQHRAVCYFIECLGTWDYELGAEVVHGEEVVGLSQELYRLFGAHIISVQILPIFGHRKICNYPFQTFSVSSMRKS